MSREKCSYLLTLDQTADAFFPAKSNARRDPSPDDSDPAADDDGELQETIQFPPHHNDADCGTIREEWYHLVESDTLHEVNVLKVTQSVVVDASHTSYNNINIHFLNYLFNGCATLL